MNKAGTQRIETQRLILRRFKIDDAEDMYDNWASDPEVTRYLLREKPLFMVPRAVGNALTFFMFVVSLVFFRSQDMTYAIQMFKQFFFWTYPGFLYRTASQLVIAENYIPRQLFSQLGIAGGETIVYMATLIILLIVSAFIMTRKNTQELVEETKFSFKTVLGLTIVFVWSKLEKLHKEAGYSSSGTSCFYRSSGLCL